MSAIWPPGDDLANACHALAGSHRPPHTRSAYPVRRSPAFPAAPHRTYYGRTVLRSGRTVLRRTPMAPTDMLDRATPKRRTRSTQRNRDPSRPANQPQPPTSGEERDVAGIADIVRDRMVLRVDSYLP